jgi:hypothetical protein
MKSRSAKNKGKRLQNAIRDMILEQFNQLEQDDVVSTLMGDSGTDIKLSPAARKAFPYSPECKNQEKMNIWASLKQAEANTKEGTTPVLFFKRNNTQVYAVIPVEHFFELAKKGTTELK